MKQSKYKIGDWVRVIANNTQSSRDNDGYRGRITRIHDGFWGDDSKQVIKCGNFYYDVDDKVTGWETDLEFIDDINIKVNPWTIVKTDWNVSPPFQEIVNDYLSIRSIDYKPINKSFMANLIDKVKMMMKGEPNKTFFKLGITDKEDDLTSEGKELFINFLFKRTSEEFNKEVAQPLLAEQEKESSK